MAEMAQIEKQFKELQRNYGLRTPGQIKQRILWKHLKLIVLHLYNSEQTKKAVAHYEAQWKLLEEVENREKK